MNDYKELIEILRDDEFCGKLDYIDDAADAIEQLAKDINVLAKERDAAVADLEKCMNYAEPKNNNVCNFCKKDMSEYPDKCDGWSDFCKCEPEWRGVIGG